MTCAHCCGAENIFDKKEANKNLNRFKKKGPNKTTSLLLNAIKKETIEGFSLMDIGGGIGVIQLELLKANIKSSTDVDASNAYIKVAKSLLKDNGYENTQFIHGDFNDKINELEKHNIVTLERVVCCYPYIEDLIDNSTSKAISYYGLVYPNDGGLSKFLNKLAHFYFWLKKNPFRTHIHSEIMMHKRIEKNGFNRIYYMKQFPWNVALYKRVQ